MDNFSIKREDKNGITLFYVSGDINLFSSNLFEDEVMKAVNKGSTKIIIDMSKVKFVRSSGLGALMKIYDRVHANNGRLVLAGVSEAVQDLLKLINVYDFFTITGDVESAMKLLSGS